MTETELNRTLFSDYNYWRLQTDSYQQMPFKRSVKWTEDRGKKLGEMAQWCQQHQIDARHWLCSLFHIKRWLYPPQWTQLIPSKKTLKKSLHRYANLGDIPMFRKRVRVEKDLHDIQHGVVFDPNRDISGTTEAYKRRHLMDGDPQLCMERMSVETFGYHPRSLVCARCPLAQACAGRLQASVNFDILALRRGEITAQQAVRQVAVYR